MYGYYLLYIILVMLVFPIISILLEKSFSKQQFNFQYFVETSAKWLIFWAVGIRCITAGISHLLNPAFTASILNTPDACFVAIKEIGLSNISMGLLAIASVFVPSWRKAGGFCGGLYLGVAGFLHVSRIPEGINIKEAIAMVSDLFIFTFVAYYLIYSYKSYRSHKI